MDRYCLKCDKQFKTLEGLGVTCRCLSGHALCTLCYETPEIMRLEEVRKLFGNDHYLNITKYHPQDIEDARNEKQDQEKATADFCARYFDQFVTNGELDFVKTIQLLESDNKLDGRWINVEPNFNKGWIDMYHRIRVPIDTRMKIYANGNLIFDKELNANEPVDLFLWSDHCVYMRFQTVCDPPIAEIECQSIQKCIGVRQPDCKVVRLDWAHKYRCYVPDNDFLFSEGSVGNKHCRKN